MIHRKTLPSAIRYPSSPEIKEKWINATRRENWFPSPYSVVCSRHFTKDCFFRMKNRRRLLSVAVPTLLLPKLEDLPQPEEELIKIKPEIQKVSQIDPLSITSIQQSDGVQVKIENETNMLDIHVPNATGEVQIKIEREETNTELPKIQKVGTIQVRNDLEATSDPLIEKTGDDTGKTESPRIANEKNIYEQPAAPIPIRPKPTETAKVFNASSNSLKPIILFQLPQQNVGQVAKQVSQTGMAVSGSSLTTKSIKPENMQTNPNLSQTLNKQSLHRRLEELLEKVEHKNRQIKNLREKNRYLKNRIPDLKKRLKYLSNVKKCS